MCDQWLKVSNWMWVCLGSVISNLGTDFTATLSNKFVLAFTKLIIDHASLFTFIIQFQKPY